ncbi:unnamed protein product [Didymodactylos carnosus]|uniref:Polycystin cation channel PKD1/PKD2 domain-containing protein n=1 Tax=Didymodactylos carnosus TaxID=1234261 RepID=A0A8S2DMU1_9BILA|nr:unnamed protein product [Didymodactylos carnosus]CAF3753230.1 unnamed protein product [Didymodactylos carnosus]
MQSSRVGSGTGGKKIFELGTVFGSWFLSVAVVSRYITNLNSVYNPPILKSSNAWSLDTKQNDRLTVTNNKSTKKVYINRTHQPDKNDEDTWTTVTDTTTQSNRYSQLQQNTALYRCQNKKLSTVTSTKRLILEKIRQTYKEITKVLLFYSIDEQIHSNTRSKYSQVKYALRTLCLYGLFLINILIVSIVMYTPEAYRLANSFKQHLIDAQFQMDFSTMSDRENEQPVFPESILKYKNNFAINYTQISTIGEIWRFLYKPLIDVYFGSYRWYNKLINLNRTMRYVLNHNLLIGMPRIRQVRVKKEECNVHQSFKDEIKDCYVGPLKYRSFREKRFVFKKRPWKYENSDLTQSATYRGKFATYNGGGYVVELGAYNRKIKRIIEELNYLQAEKWIDRATRAVFIDIITYNPSTNLFCYVSLAIELSATGGIFPQYRIETRQLMRYITLPQFYVLGCEVVCVVFTFVYLAVVIIKIAQLKLTSLIQLWNIMDIIILILSGCVILSNFRRLFVVNTVIADQTSVHDIAFDSMILSVIRIQNTFDTLMAFLTSLAFLRMFKYADILKNLIYIKATLKLCIGDLLGFLTMYIAILIAYAQFGNLVLGTKISSFSTLGQAFVTMFRIVLGDFDYEIISNASPIIGALYFFSYIFFIVFALLNQLLAIIIDTYEEVKRRRKEFEEQLLIALCPFFYQHVERFFTRIHMWSKLEQIFKKIMYKTQDYITVHDLIRKKLNRWLPKQVIDQLERDFELQKHIFLSEHDAKGFIEFARADRQLQKETIKKLFIQETSLKYLVREQEFRWRARSYCTIQEWKVLKYRTLKLEELLTLLEIKILFTYTKTDEILNPKSENISEETSTAMDSNSTMVRTNEQQS